MRRLLLFATLCSGVLVLAPAAQAADRIDLRQFAGMNTAAVSLVNGSGTAKIVRRSGAVLGSVRKGRIAVTAPRGERPGASLSGCDSRSRPNRRTIVCSGTGLHFSTRSDRRIVLWGSGINVSAVMRGRVTLKGTRGLYSIGSAGYESWPRIFRTWSVGG